MTDFVPSFSDQSLIPPWQTMRARHWAFVVGAAPGCMQSYLDTHLNAPGPDRAPYRYEALEAHDYGILTVTDHPHFECAGGAAPGWDTVAHREVFWQFPAHRYKLDDNGLMVEPELVWIQPFYFDDNATVVFASREVWGGDKQVAAITFEEGPEPDKLHLDVAIQGFTKFNPRSRSHSVGVLHIELVPKASEVDFDELIQREGVAQFIGTMLGQFPGLSEPAERATHSVTEVRIDTLKQFRDSFDMRKAAYRAIISSKATHSNLTDVRYFAGSDIALDFAWSDSMKEQFTRLFGLQEPEPENAVYGLFGHGVGEGGAKSGAAPGNAGRSAVSDGHPGKRPTDWNLPVTSIDVLYAVAFTSDARFEILDTLHTYGAGIFSP